MSENFELLIRYPGEDTDPETPHTETTVHIPKQHPEYHETNDPMTPWVAAGIGFIAVGLVALNKLLND